MRILILSSEFPPGPGGIGTHAFQLAKHFTSLHQPVVVCTAQDYADPLEVKNFNRLQGFQICQMPNHHFNLVKHIKRFWSFIKVIREFQPQIVIASGSKPIWLSALCLPVFQVPWILIGHGTEFGKKTGTKAWLTRWAANLADGAICVSEFTLRAMYDMGVTKPKGFVIHNGADQHCFYPISTEDVDAFRNQESVTEKFVMLTVGNLSKRKGQEVVIRALPDVLRAKPGVEYWMAGLPQDQQYLEQLARELGVSNAVRFWGRVDSGFLPQLYNACDLFVMTSRSLSDGNFEGFGIAVMEAALCGKPALVSNNSGLKEAVKDGVTGVIVPQDNPEATAAAIIQLCASSKKLIRLGQRARQNALENHTWDTVVGRYLSVLQGLIDG